MAIAVRICPDNMNSDDYERVIGELGEPDGRLYHAGYGDSEVEMFSVWIPSPPVPQRSMA